MRLFQRPVGLLEHLGAFALLLSDIGVGRVVIGSAAVTNPKLVEELLKTYTPSQIVVGIDAENGIPKIKNLKN